MVTKDFSHTAFQKHLLEHHLRGSECVQCGAQFLPPRPMCTDCYSPDMKWVDVPKTGELIAFTTVHITTTAMIEAGYGRNNPNCSGIVKLANGLAISAQILGVDATKPESIKIGTPVTAEFIERGEGDQSKTFLAFRVV